MIDSSKIQSVAILSLFLLNLLLCINNVFADTPSRSDITSFLPENCDFYMVLDNSTYPCIQTISMRIPLLKRAQQHLKNVLDVNDLNQSQLALVGKLKGSTVRLVLLLKGEFNRKKLLSRFKNTKSIKIQNGGGIFVVNTGQIPLGIFIMYRDVISVGRLEIMKELFTNPKQAKRNLIFSTNKQNCISLYISSKMLKILLPTVPKESKGYPELENFIAQINVLKFHSNPFNSGKSMLIITCSDTRGARNVSRLVRSLLSLMLFSLKQGEETISDLLSTVKIKTENNNIFVRFIMPTKIFNSLLPTPSVK